MTGTFRTSLIILVSVCCTPLGATADRLAFPGAEGFGVATDAGRGGRVFYVTNVNDDGPGSLRRAIEQSIPRTVVFEVAGTIELESKLRITSPYISILGQTAPEPGITIKGNSVTILTHDVLIQHLRVRIGDDTSDPRARDLDAIQILAHPSMRDRYPETFGTYNVVIDHCSFSWAMDEIMSAVRARDVTISNCILSEGLDESIHTASNHSMGALFSKVHRLAFVNNLIAHCASRTPKLSGSTESVICNNVVYNSRWIGVEVSGMPGDGPPKATIVGNVVIPGPDSRSGTRFPVWVNRVPPKTEIYVADNPCRMFEGDDWACVNQDSTVAAARVGAPPIECPGLTIRSADQTLQWVLANAGARPAHRDPVDARIIDEVANKKGRIIDSQNEVGGWPETGGGERRLDPPKPTADFERWLAAFIEEVEGRKPGSE